jgi:Leucine-rich repeat (LRR) protein
MPHTSELPNEQDNTRNETALRKIVALISAPGSHTELVFPIEDESCALSIPDLSSIADELETLDLTESNVSDLTPLRCLIGKKLTTLRLMNTRVTSLKPIKDIITIENLDLCGAPVSDLNALEGFINLRELNIADTVVSDLSPVRNLPITELNIQNTDTITSIESLRGMATLEVIHFSRIEMNRDELADVLKSMPKIAEVYIDMESLSGLSPEDVEYIGNQFHRLRRVSVEQDEEIDWDEDEEE